MVEIPKLVKSKRSREFNKYPENKRAEVVFEYLFHGVSHRNLDEQTLGLSSSYSRGYQSMGILHFLGLKDSFKGVFKGYKLPQVLGVLSTKGAEYKQLAHYLSIHGFGQTIQTDLTLFQQNLTIKPLLKKLGSSQYSDGVRIDKSYHGVFNPPDSDVYTERGTARNIWILFNNKIFEAVYRYEGQTDQKVELQSIRFQKDLKDEFKSVFPLTEGEFAIAAGTDLNHFIFLIENTDPLDIEEAADFSEGKTAYKLHKFYERNPKVVKKAKSNYWKKNGFFQCEACGFRFDEVYGTRGRKFIEGHHTKPVSEMVPGDTTSPEDIALLCSNCHRMVHRKPFISVEQLASTIQKQKQ